ncbi:MAG: hypothetical protein HOP06_07585 [Methylotenera sp.]|nr:hypothetical protein [Methylotenera sp.]
MNLYPVTIVENFYENPNAIRKFALAQEYKFCHEIQNVRHIFPGCRTQDLLELDQKLYEKICKKLISVFHNTEHDHMRWAISTSFQSVSAEYNQGVIHSDHNTIFAAVLYLTPDAPLNSGTSLFKKNKTFNEKKYIQALDDNDARFKAGEIKMLTDYHSMFDEIVRVNNLYNTLIIYEGRHFHAANQFFGKTLKDSRLAQVFFISKIDAKKQSVFPISRVKMVDI